MTLLKSRKYIDLIELTEFVHKKYGWPKSGRMNSFHSVFSQAADYPHNGELYAFELLTDENREDYESEAYNQVDEVFKMLIKDGYLPNEPAFNVHVWW